MLINIGLVIAGLALLVWSADRFVFGAAALARNFGLSPLIIGLTIVAIGSSAPEFMVAANASLNSKPDTAIGNAIGSNITNITLVLGLTALIKPLLVSSMTIKRELPIVLATSGLAVLLLLDYELSALDGWLLLAAFITTIGLLTWFSIKGQKEGINDPLEQDLEDEVPSDVPNVKAITWLVIGMILLPVSSELLVSGSVDIAKHFGISDLVIGLTIIAIGTSLPELAASLAGVLKGEDDLALGNIIGSNIFNALGVLAIPGILASGAVDPSAVNRDSVVMMVVTVLLLIMAVGLKGPRSINRVEGFALLACFIGYQYFLFAYQPV